ncbi:MAG: VWA domain-containing protein [Planctomycetes bacterium]|nr:VWA domain-containing protein [Planctomycetota bacterium]
MSWTEAAARLLGLEDASALDGGRVSFAAPWAGDAPAWVLFGCAALAAATALFYARLERPASRRARRALATARALALSLLLLALAEPVLTLQVTSRPKPLLWLLLDGTESMAIEDELEEAESALLTGAPRRASRAARLVALLAAKEIGLVERLAERFRLRAFLLERPDGVRALEWGAAGAAGSAGAASGGATLAGQVTTAGQVTALGAALDDLARRRTSERLAGVVVFGDFGQNAGPPPVEAARRLGVPLFTVGIGPEAATDIALDLQASPVLKAGERAGLAVTLRQTGLDGRRARVRVAARRAGEAGERDGAEETLVGERDVELRGPVTALDLDFVPREAGRVELEARVEPLEGEAVAENNRAAREATVRDDFLRLLFVEHEPTWEWRFIKEVFHRDPLVGMRGFRTFLRSADPKVRQSNELFVPALTASRSEFFANDVVFLGDVPASALTTRFCEMTRELVGRFGGGLVVISGPRFGPGQLAGTALAEMLPVVVEPGSRLREGELRRLRLRPEAFATDFMRLGAGDAETARAWDGLGPLAWYQPVVRLHPLATALAEHPSDTCAGSGAPQPLIALRSYGAGEVVYLAFNETWRLRRKQGERLYRQLWGAMIHRLGLSHALGTQKRFVLRTDRPSYRVDDRVLVTVEAYDADFEPLAGERLPGRKLEAELVLPARAGAPEAQPLALRERREGVFEAEVQVLSSGEHRLRVQDPIAGEMREVAFRVADASVERRTAVRNAALERELAAATGGRCHDLATAAALPAEIEAPETAETSVRVVPLWSTWLLFAAVVALLLGEWLLRKAVNLP